MQFDFTFEIERLRKQVLGKELNFDHSKSIMIDLNIDTDLVITPHDYYYHIFQQLYYLLLNDNLQINFTKYDMFKRYWKLAKKNELQYNCWITQLSEHDKEIMLKNIVNVANDFNYDESTKIDNHNNMGCGVCIIM